jgi:outer membrane immunogenic protein
MKFHSSAAAVGLILGLAVSLPASAQDILGPWTGFYVGAHAGGAFDPNNLSFTDQSATQDLSFRTKNASRFLGGVHGGYDWDAGNLLVGVEGDVSFARDINYLASARGRLGFPVGPFLLYGTGGAAFEGAHERFTVLQPDFPGIFNFSRNISRTGWTAGAGVDYMIGPGVSFGVEGLYYGLGSGTSGLLTPAGGGAEPFTVKDDRNFGVVRARLTYHFGLW